MSLLGARIPPAYWFFSTPAGPVAPPEPPAVVRARSSVVAAAVVDLLGATKAFGSVDRITGPDDMENSRTNAESAVGVWAARDEDEWISTSGDKPDLMLSGVVMIRLSVRHANPAERADRLDRLKELIKNTVEGRALGGAAMPWPTIVRRSAMDPMTTAPPVVTWFLELSWQTFITGFDSHDTIDDVRVRN